MFENEASSSSTASLSSSNSLDSLDRSTSCLSSPQVSYKNLSLTKILNKAKFPVLLGKCPSVEELLAVKMFAFQDNQMHRCYLNEVLFAHLRHQNIISILHHEPEREVAFEDCTKKVSYTIMEFAPYGDFCDLIISQKVKIDDRLARTYFHQLIEGVEYLHSVGVAHLDLKLENLLIGTDYNLKICDFDQAYLKGQSTVLSKGTVNYRAPELFQRQCHNLKAADIYSVGVILFALKCGGVMPYCEVEEFKGFNTFELMTKQPELFWDTHCKLQGRSNTFFNEDFKALFMSMVSLDPEERPSIQQIKNSRWYVDSAYAQEDLELIMKSGF